MPPANTFLGLHRDPEGQARLAAQLPKVCSSLSVADKADRQTLIRISQNPALNPLTRMIKQEQSQTSTCASHAGSSAREAFEWMRTGAMVQYSRLYLYLAGKLEWDTSRQSRGRFVDDGCSIPSIAAALQKGVPLEVDFPWQPDSSRWPNVQQFIAAQTPQLLAKAAANRLPHVTEASPDFDVAVARVLLKDPILWGTGWPFPFGSSGHAHAPLWAEWNGRDFDLLVFNSHLNNFVFKCSRSQYTRIIAQNSFGAYHLEGEIDLRFRAETMLVM